MADSVDEILARLDGWRQDRIAREIRAQVAAENPERQVELRVEREALADEPGQSLFLPSDHYVDQTRERFLDVLMHRALADPKGEEAAEYYVHAGETAEETWQRMAPQRELESEMLGYRDQLRPADIDLALKLGVAKADIAGGLLGLARVSRVEPGSDRWVPSEDGLPMFVTPARMSPAARSPYHIESTHPSADVRVGEMVDIIAWRPRPEDRWLLRTGDAAALGATKYHLSADDREPLAVRTGPLDWLRHRGEGIVLLSRDREEQKLVLLGADEIIVENHRLRDQIKGLLERPQVQVHVQRPDRQVEAPNVIELPRQRVVQRQ